MCDQACGSSRESQTCDPAYGSDCAVRRAGQTVSASGSDCAVNSLIAKLA